MVPKKDCNRIIEWDIAKAIAIVGMILVHCKIAMLNTSHYPIYNFITEFFGSPAAAPIFMFLLGTCISFSKHNTPSALFKRGIKLFLLSYVFNLLAFSLPYTYRTFFYNESLDTHSFIMILFSSDILGFAGLAFIFFAIVRKMNLSTQTILLTLASFMLLNHFLLTHCQIQDSRFLQLITGPFYGTHPDSYFPFLSWIGYPIAGYLFSKKIYSENTKAKTYRNLGCVGLLVFTILTIIATLDTNETYFSIFNPESGDDERFYWHGLFTYTMFLGWIFFELWICFLISKIIKKAYLTHLQRWSKNITLMYVISYIPIFIIDVTIFNRNPSLSFGYTFLISIVIFILTDFISSKYRQIKSKNTTKLTQL